MAATSPKNDGTSISAWPIFSTKSHKMTVVIDHLEQKARRIIYRLHMLQIKLSCITTPFFFFLSNKNRYNTLIPLDFVCLLACFLAFHVFDFLSLLLPWVMPFFFSEIYWVRQTVGFVQLENFLLLQPFHSQLSITKFLISPLPAISFNIL